MAALLGLLVAAAGSQAAAADGPGTGGRTIRLENEPVGPYLLRVVTSPTPPRVGSLFLEIRVQSGATRAVLTDVQVTAAAIPTEHAGPPIVSRATQDYAPTPLDYAAHLPVTSAGVWEIQVRVQGHLGEGEISFLQRISSSAAWGAGLSLALPVVGIGGLLLAFTLLRRQSAKLG